MFNLLISYDTTDWEGDGRMRASVERFKEYSGNEADGIDARAPATLKILESIPSILMYERGAPGNSVARVRIGFLGDLRVEDIVETLGRGRSRTTTYLTFSFEVLGELSQFDVFNAASVLQIDEHRWELTRTHWAIKNGRIPIDLLRRSTKSAPKTLEDEIREMLALPAETDEVEFKETLHWDVLKESFHDDRLMDVAKAICAMLNRSGGTILIGVQDVGNHPVGIARDLIKYKSADAFQRKIAEPFGVKLKPDPSDLVNVRFVTIDGATLARVDVRPDYSHHYALQDKVYVRRDGESRELTGLNLAAWAARRSKGEE